MKKEKRTADSVIAGTMLGTSLWWLVKGALIGEGHLIYAGVLQLMTITAIAIYFAE
jgi:hypothetical protein